jgi:hypothetical protein
MATDKTPTVGETVSPRWIDHLADELLAIEADSEVGSRCITLLRKADEMLALMDESDDIALCIEAATGQCHVWYFG